MITITREALEPEAITSQVRSKSCGAVVTFLGTTRSETDGRRVVSLEYEAYQPMAEKVLGSVVQEIRRRWGVERVAIAHRIGPVGTGEISLVVAVAAPHRAEAFAACQYVVDRLKEDVPIWKKEVFQDGHVWVGGQTPGHPPFTS